MTFPFTYGIIGAMIKESKHTEKEVMEALDQVVGLANANEALLEAPRLGAKPHNKNTIKNFKPVHKTICEMAALGKARKDIAKILGVSYKTVLRTLRSADAPDTLKQAQHDFNLDLLMKRINSMTGKAMDILTEVMATTDKEGQALRVKIAHDLLDRSDAKAADRKELTINDTYNSIREAIEEVAVEEGEVIGHA